MRCVLAESDIFRGVMKMVKRLRTPTKSDVDNADRWLAAAQQELKSNEFFRVKLLCRQVIRALRRKEHESR